MRSRASLLALLCLAGAGCPEQSWKPQSSPTTANLYAVWGASAVDVYVVGANGTILHSTNQGGTWTAQQSATTHTLYSVWGSGPTDIYAVGELGTIVHSDGKTWQTRDSLTTFDLTGVWGSGANDLYIVGANVPMLRSTDGVIWTPRGGPFAALVAIWGSGPDDVYAVGSDAASGQTGVVHLTDGGSTATVATQFPAETRLRSVGAARAGEVFAVGQGLIFRTTDQGQRWVGDAQADVPRDLSCVWGHPQQGVYLVGPGGKILHQSQQGGTFLTESTSTNQTLRAVWGDGVSTLFAVGDLGTILH